MVLAEAIPVRQYDEQLSGVKKQVVRLVSQAGCS